jgi:hypothetical protein
MMTRNPQSKKPRDTDMELAIAALDGNPNPVDMDMTGIDPAPTSLDLDEGEKSEMCSTPPCSRPAVDECMICGQPLREERIGLPGTEADESGEAHAGVDDDHAEKVL